MKSKSVLVQEVKLGIEKSFGPSAEKRPESAFQREQESKNKLGIVRGLHITGILCKPIFLAHGDTAGLIDTDSTWL